MQQAHVCPKNDDSAVVQCSSSTLRCLRRELLHYPQILPLCVCASVFCSRESVYVCFIVDSSRLSHILTCYAYMLCVRTCMCVAVASRVLPYAQAVASRVRPFRSRRLRPGLTRMLMAVAEKLRRRLHYEFPLGLLAIASRACPFALVRSRLALLLCSGLSCSVFSGMSLVFMVDRGVLWQCAQAAL